MIYGEYERGSLEFSFEISMYKYLDQNKIFIVMLP